MQRVVNVRDRWSLSRNVSESGLPASTTSCPNLQHETLTPLTTQAVWMQIGYDVQLNALINILEFQVNWPAGT